MVARRAGLGWVALTAGLVLTVAGCNDTGATDGPVLQVCGQTIATPGPGMSDGVPFYRDITSQSGRAALQLPASAHGDAATAPWIRVSHSCQHGAAVTVVPSGAVKVRDSVRTSDGEYAAVQLQGFHLGNAVVTVVKAGKTEARLAVTVTQPPA